MITDLILVTSAASFGANAHRGQLRKELNEPYINHPIRVARLAAILGFPAEFIAACFLHDVIEDCGVTEKVIRSSFPTETADLVVAMSKWWGDDTQNLTEDIKRANNHEYYQRLLRTPGGMNLKFLDRADNMKDFVRMAQQTPKLHKWALNYLRRTEEEFPPFYPHVGADVKAVFDAALINLRLEVRE